MKTQETIEADKGFILLQAIEQDGDVSQRELSSRTGLSLGSVNLLLQKMIRDGLVKMKMIPANRVVYMLTPQGMAEKAHKTIRYIRRHYQLIESSKDMIHKQLNAYHQQYELIYLCLPGNDLDELIAQVVDEYTERHKERKLCLVTEKAKLPENAKEESSILLTIPTDSEYMKKTAGSDSITQASLFDSPE
jgi:DNA-binding MarR family transcriptional regulator